MSLFYLGCLLLLLVVVMFVISNTRAKSKEPNLSVDIDDDSCIDEDTACEEDSDLYETVCDFMARQRQYIDTLG